ncbi:hypothetical protein LINPERHAP1_LOCUS21937 [Linum perenne]
MMILFLPLLIIPMKSMTIWIAYLTRFLQM